MYYQSQTSSALQLVVPAVFQRAAVAARYNAPTSDHIGINKMVGSLTLDYCWDTLRCDVERFVCVCDTYQPQNAARQFRYSM